MVSARVRLGELLVDAQIITREQLQEVLNLQRNDGRRLGTLLVESGLVTETQVTQLLSQQLSVPWVSLYHIDFSRQLLNTVTQELAEKYCLVPIFVRKVRGMGQTLYVAMDDPTDEAAQREVSTWSGLPVRAMIAPPTDIRSAIRVYYGGGNDSPSLSQAVAQIERDSAQPAANATPSAEPGNPPAEQSPAPEPKRVSAPPQPAESAPSQQAEPSPSELSAPAAPPSSEPSARDVADHDEGPVIEAREVQLPSQRRAATRRALTLTLLDGTQVKIPTRHRSPSAESAQKTGPEALVAALRRGATAAELQQMLGADAKWEPLVLALLSLLLKKHLIYDWEFVEEYKKFDSK